MKNLCITGSVQNSLKRFAAVLQSGGATPAVPADRNREMSMETWHRKVLAIFEARDADLASPPTLGRVWEQMAGDIFLANHDQPLWFWAERGSIQLLDFWQEFDPQTRFLLVYDSPVSALTSAIEEGAESLEELQECLDQWYLANQMMLRFHLRHPACSVLIRSEAATNSQTCLTALATRWALPLDAGIESAINNIWPSANALYLMEQLLQGNSQVQALHNEVQACLLLPADAPQSDAPAQLEQAFLAYLSERRAQLENKQKTRQLTETADKQHQQIDQLGNELEASQQNSLQLQAQLEQAARQQQDTEQHLQDCEEENKLLLDHLHQTQEELEQQIIQNQAQTQALDEQKTRNAALVEEAKALRTACDEQGKLATERQQQHDALAKEKAQLIAERDQQRQLVSERQAQIERLQTQLADVESENDLILLQLHETQEELEQYLLKSQDSEERLATLHQRLSKMQARYPGYWTCDNLEVTTVDDGATSQWHFINTEISGRLLPELSFTLQRGNGLAGLLLQRTAAASPLLRWPAAFAGSDTLPCVPANGSVVEGSNAALTSLGSSDWQFLQNLLRQLIALLDDPQEQRLPATLNRATLRQALLALQSTLANWPNVLRYDSIELQGNQQLPEYDSLELRLDNLQLGEHHWPSLQFRLASVDPQAGCFGQNPRLEFPESSRDSLQNWYAESTDERGSRLELRFALPDAIDIPVWQSLAPQDQLLIAGLLVSLPRQLSELKASGVTSERAWQDWQALAVSMRHILASTSIAASIEQGTAA